MSDMITFNTEQNTIFDPASIDPWHHLEVDAWVQKQIEWGEANPSGRGLVEYLNKIFVDDNVMPPQGLIGAEIGVCLGVTTELLLNETNTDLLYAVDNYPTYIDWNGLPITAERQDRIKAHAAKRLSKFTQYDPTAKYRFGVSNAVYLAYMDSTEFAKTIPDNHLDYVFIDADHSYEGALRDLKQYYPKVQRGGIFAGHDLNLPSVNKALFEFFGEKVNKIIPLVDNAWLYYKD